MRVLLRYETAESTGREIYEEYELAFLGVYSVLPQLYGLKISSVYSTGIITRIDSKRKF
jgi:hypothetical protein